jgi:hypothetical protein
MFTLARFGHPHAMLDRHEQLENLLEIAVALREAIGHSAEPAVRARLENLLREVMNRLEDFGPVL